MSNPLPPNWVAYQTQDGKIFYSNSVTGESRWEKPVVPQEVTFGDWSDSSESTSVKGNVKKEGLLLFPFMFLAIPFGGLFSISMGAPIISYGGQFPTMQYAIRLSYFVLFFVFSRSAFRRCSDDKQRDSSARRMFVFITFLALVGFFTILLPMQLINGMSIVGFVMGYGIIMLSFYFNTQYLYVWDSDSARIIERLVGGLVMCFITLHFLTIP